MTPALAGVKLMDRDGRSEPDTDFYRPVRVKNKQTYKRGTSSKERALEKVYLSTA